MNIPTNMIAIDINIAVIGLVGRVYVSDVTKKYKPDYTTDNTYSIRCVAITGV